MTTYTFRPGPREWTLQVGDSREVLRLLPDASVDSCVCDPPYELGFMGKAWDGTGIAYDVGLWREVLRVLKPGGHLLAFGGTRTHHRMACAIEDAGFEVRDMIAWAYSTGFPKSLDVSKELDKHGGKSVAWFGPWLRQWREENGITQKQIASLFPSKNGQMTGCVANWERGFNMPTTEQYNKIKDVFGLPFVSIYEAERAVVGKHAGDMGGLGGERLGQPGGAITAPATEAARQWSGWGTALKPAMEPVCVARKPLAGTVAQNVLTHGTGALNVDACRVGTDGGDKGVWPVTGRPMKTAVLNDGLKKHATTDTSHGRWPANIIHDGSDAGLGDAARFFYCPKTSTWERNAGCTHLPARTGAEAVDRAEGSAGLNSPRAGAQGKASSVHNFHPTVKPVDLMRYLVTLVTPAGGLVLDPFAGSGSTGCGAMLAGCRFHGVELEPDHAVIARARLKFWADYASQLELDAL